MAPIVGASQVWTGGLIGASKEAEMDFSLSPAVLPACGCGSSLADLIYDWPQGFARFSWEAMNPNMRDLPPEMKREFVTMLGCIVRKIWQHF